jgi:hypothetical protein
MTPGVSAVQFTLRPAFVSATIARTVTLSQQSAMTMNANATAISVPRAIDVMLTVTANAITARHVTTPPTALGRPSVTAVAINAARNAQIIFKHTAVKSPKMKKIL